MANVKLAGRLTYIALLNFIFHVKFEIMGHFCNSLVTNTMNPRRNSILHANISKIRHTSRPLRTQFLFNMIYFFFLPYGAFRCLKTKNLCMVTKNLYMNGHEPYSGPARNENDVHVERDMCIETL